MSTQVQRLCTELGVSANDDGQSRSVLADLRNHLGAAQGGQSLRQSLESLRVLFENVSANTFSKLCIAP